METTRQTAAERRREKNRRYHHANKERLNAASRAYQKANRERINAMVRAGYDEERRAAKKAYYERNRERILKQKREYFLRNKEAIDRYRQTKRKEISAWNSRWHRENRERIRPRKREESRRRNLDPSYRLAHRLRGRITRALKGRTKPDRTEALLGCSFGEFRQYIGRLLRPGMTMDNYGSKWHIDHIIPCSAFDMTKEGQIRQCFHFTNLRPMWARANIRKGARITEPQMKLLL